MRADPPTIAAALSRELGRTAIVDLPTVLRERGILGIHVRARGPASLLVSYRRSWGPGEVDTLRLKIRMHPLPQERSHLLLEISEYHNLWIGPAMFAGGGLLVSALGGEGAGWLYGLAIVILVVTTLGRMIEREDAESEFLLNRALGAITRFDVAAE